MARPTVADDTPTSRRSMLRALAAGAAGAVAGATLLDAQPAAAAPGNLLSETTNNTTATTEVRMANTTADVAFVVQDSTYDNTVSNRPAVLAGWGGADRAGVYGYTVGTTSDTGRANSVEIAGVVGECAASVGRGVLAVATGPSGIGLHAVSGGSGGIGAQFEGEDVGAIVYTIGPNAASLIVRQTGGNADPAGLSFPTGALYVTEQNQDNTTLWYGPGGDGVDFRRLAGANTAGALTVLPSPVRLLDTRAGKLPAGNKGKVSTTTKTFNVKANATGVPAYARAVLVNITVTGAAAGGYLKAWPAGATEPTASIINWSAGQTIANFATVGLGTGEQLSVKASGATDLILDISGYYR